MPSMAKHPTRTRRRAPSRRRRTADPRAAGAARRIARRVLREDIADTHALGLAAAPAISLVPVRGIDNTTAVFREKVMHIAARLGTNPNFLMAVMSFESGGTFSPSVKNQAGSGAVGLIQFMPATARGLGTTTTELAALTAEAQLDFVEKHFKPFTGRLQTLEDTYMAVLLPKAVGKGRDFVLFERPSIAFTQNKGLDIDGDGRITVADASSRVRAVLSEAGAGSGEVLGGGASGPEVETLQDQLIELGHLRPAEKAGGPGTFGPRTERALSELQSINGLEVTGVLDSASRDALHQLMRGVGIGSSGAVVRSIQQRLVRLGNLTNAQAFAAAGRFDDATEAAVRQLQQQHGLEASGIVSPATYRALAAAVPPITLTMSGAAIDTVLPESGRGFTTFNREPGGADQVGVASTILAIQTIGAAWASTHDCTIFVGDISRRGGGSFPPHSAHKDGRDVDMRPFRHHGEPGPTNINEPSYDHALTRELVVLIRQKFVAAMILFNDPLLVADGLTRRFAGHDNHLHVRFT
jgi:peptidoglycan hydrolase-like protein with peptidoglycan-binding domain